MDHLSIDLETFSSVPIAKAGAQKYIASPDFEILLLPILSTVLRPCAVT